MHVTLYVHMCVWGECYTVKQFEQHEHTHAHTQAPDIPGQYELRYYPAWLSGSYSGYRHEIYWAAKQFTVSGN